MFAKVLVAAGLAVSLAGYVANRPAAELPPNRTQTAPTANAEVTRLADPTTPAGLPASLAIQWQGVTSRATFVPTPYGEVQKWASPAAFAGERAEVEYNSTLKMWNVRIGSAGTGLQFVIFGSFAMQIPGGTNIGYVAVSP